MKEKNQITRWPPTLHHVRLCVQRRLVYSGGIKPSRVKVSDPLAWVATVEEMKLLKPTDKVLFSRISELSGCNANERIGGPESDRPSGRAFIRKVKTAGTVEKLTDTAVSLGGVVATA